MLVALVAFGKSGPYISGCHGDGLRFEHGACRSADRAAPSRAATEAQIARGTGADEGTVGEWLERRRSPASEPGQHLAELIALVQEMAINVGGKTLAG